MNFLFSNKFAFTALALALAVSFQSCNKDDDHNHPHNEQEQITTLRLTLVNQNDTTDVRQIAFIDADGEGGQNGIITPDTLRLAPGTIYAASLQLLDQSNPADIKDIGAEIANEANDHQFFYTALQGLGLTFSNYDLDQNGLPLGLKATITTPAQPAKGSMRIALSHFDETPKNGTTPSGETDIEVVFPVSVQP